MPTNPDPGSKADDEAQRQAFTVAASAHERHSVRTNWSSARRPANRGRGHTLTAQAPGVGSEHAGMEAGRHALAEKPLRRPRDRELRRLHVLRQVSRSGCVRGLARAALEPRSLLVGRQLSFGNGRRGSSGDRIAGRRDRRISRTIDRAGRQRGIGFVGRHRATVATRGRHSETARPATSAARAATAWSAETGHRTGSRTDHRPYHTAARKPDRRRRDRHRPGCRKTRRRRERSRTVGRNCLRTACRRERHRAADSSVRRRDHNLRSRHTRRRTAIHSRSRKADNSGRRRTD